MGAQTVLLSLGSRGVVAKGVSGLFEAVPPRVDAVCPIGAGDAAAAAFTWASAKNKSFTDCIRWSVAAGTASAMRPGVEFATLEQTKEVYKNVEVRAIS
jgi:fructose-1-phosphate kinase PfkB-like protein